MELATLEVKVNGRAAAREVDALSTALDKNAKSAAAMSTAMKAVGAAIGTGTFLALRKMVNETIEAQHVQSQLEAGLRSTAGASRQTLAALNAQSTALMRMSTFSDEAVGSAQLLLLKFTKIGGDTFPRATRAIVDMATRMGGDLKGAALQVGKALNDPTGALSSLTRAGVQFSDAQKVVIDRMVETNDLAGAQAVILAELERKFGGSAAAARNTLGGALAALSNEWGNLFEAGTETANGMTRAVNFLTESLQKSREMADRYFAATRGPSTAGISLPAFGINSAAPIIISAELTEEGKRRKAFEDARRNAKERAQWELEYQRALVRRMGFEERFGYSARKAHSNWMGMARERLRSMLDENDALGARATVFRRWTAQGARTTYRPGDPVSELPSTQQNRYNVIPKTLSNDALADIDRIKKSEAANEEIARNFRENLQRATGDVFAKFLTTGTLSVRGLFDTFRDIGANALGQMLSASLSRAMGNANLGVGGTAVATGIVGILGTVAGSFGGAQRAAERLRKAMEATASSIADFAMQGASRFLSPEQQEIAGIRSQSRSIGLSAIGSLQSGYLSSVNGLTGNPSSDIPILQQRLDELSGAGNSSFIVQARRDIQSLINQFRALDAATQNNIAAIQRESALRTADSLKAFGGSLSLSQFSPLGPTAQLREARTQYQSLLARALGGDQAAADQFQGSAQQLLGLSRSVNASGGRYTADFNTVTADTARLEALFRERGTTAERAATAAEDTAENTGVGNEITRNGFEVLIEENRLLRESVDTLVRLQRDAAAVA